MPFDSISIGPARELAAEFSGLQRHHGFAGDVLEVDRAATRIELELVDAFDGQVAAAVSSCEAAVDFSDGRLAAGLDELDGRDVADLDFAAAGLHANGKGFWHPDDQRGALSGWFRVGDRQDHADARFCRLDRGFARVALGLGFVVAARPNLQLAVDVLTILARNRQGGISRFEPDFCRAGSNRHCPRRGALGGGAVAANLAAHVVENSRDRETLLTGRSGRRRRVVDERADHDESADQQ